jgi:lipid II isoglutaminyl synthase (glutamine-hydrolysing)
MTFVGRRESRAAAEATHTGAGPLAGFESHSGRTCLGPGAAPLGRVIAGSGNNGEDGTEGARYREVYATYLHGPVLPKNPWLTDHLISRALRHRNGDMGPSGSLAPLEDHAEAEAHAAALRLACRPARRWGAAAAAGSRRWQPGQAGTDDLAGREAQPAGRGMAWISR